MIGSLSITDILIIIGVLLVSMSVHEAMHAFVGLKLGDDTAAEKGRISLNPLSHVDPFLTIILPAITLILFQTPILAAKPVPFDPERVRFDEFGGAMIAAAGPLSNLVLAVIAAAVARLAGLDTSVTGLADYIVQTFITLNVALFVFNMVPIPPLDGSRVLYAFAPEPLQNLMRQVEPIGLFIIFALILTPQTHLSSIISNLNDAVLNFLI